MGLYVRIYSPPSGRDCLSVLPDGAETVYVSNCDGPFVRHPGEPAVTIQPGPIPGAIRAVPLDDDGLPVAGVMFGGRYIACSDSRFGELASRMAGFPFYGAVALHDRREY